MTGQPRYLLWNLGFVAFEACLIGWAHFAVGVSWAAIGAGFAVVVVFGAALLTYAVKVHVPRQQRRHQLLLQTYRTAADNQHQHQEPVRALPALTGQASRTH